MNLPKFAKRWWPVWVGAAVGMIIGAVVAVLVPATYTASTILFLGSPVSTDSAGAYSGDLFSQQRAATYSGLFASTDLAVKVIDDLSLDLTPAELITKVAATQVPKTVLLDISVTDESAEVASEIANAYADNFTEYVERLETPVGQTEPSSVVTVIQEADVPDAPSSTSGLLTVLAGLGLGLVVGLGIAWLLGKLDRSVSSPQQAADVADATLLGSIPAERPRRSARLQLPADGSSAYAEAVRQLRTTLTYFDAAEPPRTIAFVGPQSGLATTATVVDLAQLIAEVDRRVAIVDADLRSGRAAAYAGVDSDSGLTTVVAGAGVLADVLVELPGTGVDVLLGGPPPQSPSQVLSSDAVTRVLAELRDTHDFVVVDTPGSIAVTDAAVIAVAADGVVIVAEEGRTNSDQLAQTAATLRNVGARVLGVVVTETH